MSSATSVIFKRRPSSIPASGCRPFATSAAAANLPAPGSWRVFRKRFEGRWLRMKAPYTVSGPPVWNQNQLGYKRMARKYPYFKQRAFSPLYIVTDYNPAKGVVSNDELIVSYTLDSGREFHRVKEAIEGALPGVMVTGEGRESRGGGAGVFEVRRRRDGQVLYASQSMTELDPSSVVKTLVSHFRHTQTATVA
ncbi:unnamed protein product [Vitrella brassicaformis CCMP3155]|uniref:Uncharacterized protein n=1 Tax=Vitrella brassicaformis (strain CCMP3155) TaxID=1169540 RepID=A0A0G4EJV8_VITBC|nr:unnamed protein product [Vitrella brassicaformis CCMP3155]|eukprot:CEL97037.1 unnamed protein product [Vitrella brassicaformis CCMP3155]